MIMNYRLSHMKYQISILSFCVLAFATSNAYAAFPGLTLEHELALYKHSAVQCKGQYADRAVHVAFTKYYAWKTHGASDQHTFRDAAEAFEYLYKDLGCRNPLIVYRYANMLRHVDRWRKTIEVMRPYLKELAQLSVPHYAWGMFIIGLSYNSLGKPRKAIRYYHALVKMAPKWVSPRLNMVANLNKTGHHQAAMHQARRALHSQYISAYGRSVARGIIEKAQKALQ